MRFDPFIERLEDRRLLATVPAGFEDSVVATGISSPVAMAFAPDGRLFVTEKGGRLRIIRNGQLLASPALSLSVDSRGERGLLGLAFDPNFRTNNHIYVYYTRANPLNNRLSRFTLNGDVVVNGSERVLLDLPPLRAATNHNGGAVHFGPDGKLYLAVGEIAEPNLAQGLDTVFGKMLRLNPDGTIPSDNPFFNRTTGINRAIWSIGLRNPFTFAFRPANGEMFINDVGQNNWEEINVGRAGANFGWPGSEGNSNLQSGHTAPLFTYSHRGLTPLQGRCIAGGVFYDGANATNFPGAYRGDYLFADYVNGWIANLDLSSPSRPVSTFATGLDQPVDLDVGPDGSLFALTRGNLTGVGGQVIRIRFVQQQPPTITRQPASVSASVGQPATFSVLASGSNLAYQWQRNEQNINGATSSSYTINGINAADNNARFRVIVRNSVGSVTSNNATLTVTNPTNQPPRVTFAEPFTSLRFVAGQPVRFSASASDPEEGSVPASRFTWRVDYWTGPAVRPFLASTTNITAGTFTPPTVTPYLNTDVFFRITLSVSDSRGATTTVTRDVLPKIVRVTIASQPDRATFTLDGRPFVAGTFDAVAGLQRTVAAPSIRNPAIGGRWQFVNWSNGGAISQTFTTPTTDFTLTATYRRVDLSSAPSGRPGPTTSLSSLRQPSQRATSFIESTDSD